MFAYIHMANRKTNFALFLLLGFVSSAIAQDHSRYDISRSWFKPSLSVNNDPRVCAPLLRGYSMFFASTQATHPLHANLDGKRTETDSIAAITKNLREVRWKDEQIGNTRLRIAEFRIQGKFYAVVRRDYSIGWREGYFHHILITRPLAEYQLAEEDLATYFDANGFVVFAPTDDAGVLAAINRKDPRSRDYKSNIYGSVASIYEMNGSLYISFVTDKPQPVSYLVLKMHDHEKFSVVCNLQTTPSQTQIDAQFAKLPGFKALIDDLSAMMGISGNCGTLNSLARADNAMRAALSMIAYRPWANRAEGTSDPDQTARRNAVDVSLRLWGYSGIWNYFKYNSYVSRLPKAETEIRNFCINNFSLSEGSAESLARTATSHALIRGFDNGSLSDENHELRTRILDGTISAHEMEDIRPQVTAYAGEESLLTFAVAHPDILARLLHFGLSPNKPNAFGKTPLMYAAQFNLPEAARILLEHGAYTEATTTATSDTCSYVIGTKNVSALHYAVRYASKEFIKLLLMHGAPTFIADSRGYTPFDYLTKYGGMEGYHRPAKESYGVANRLLTPDDREELKVSLLPPDEQKKKVLSQQDNLVAENLYRQGKLEESYRSLRRAILLDGGNERAQSNLSLVALRLGRLGESAKASSTLIETAKSDSEKANAYFNLGLVCRRVGQSGFHYSSINYDGVSYCFPGYHSFGTKRIDRSVLPNFLAAYKLGPTKERLAAILSLLQDVDMKNKKRVCRFPEDGSGIRSLYLSGIYINFLVDSSKEVPFKKVIRRYGRDDTELAVKSKESIPLTEKLKIERWVVEGNQSGSLMLDNKICSPAFSDVLDAGTKLIEIFSNNPSSTSLEDINVELAISDAAVIILYGNQISWTLTGDLAKTLGVYVHGQSTLRIPESPTVPVFVENKYAFPDPRGSSFNPYTRSVTGLTLDAIVDVGRSKTFVLTDQLLKQNQVVPVTPPKSQLRWH
jgi:tetratricopeptide (TPR) repeat protein